MTEQADKRMKSSRIKSCVEKVIDNMSNDFAILVIGAVLLFVVYKVPPDTSWMGELLIGGISGIIGYLTGKPSK